MKENHEMQQLQNTLKYFSATQDESDLDIAHC